MAPRVYLVSKRLDPLLGIASGLWAYYLYEQRANRPEGHTLKALLERKWEQRNAFKATLATSSPNGMANSAEDEGWKELEREFQAKDGPPK